MAGLKQSIVFLEKRKVKVYVGKGIEPSKEKIDLTFSARISRIYNTCRESSISPCLVAMEIVPFFIC